MSENWFPKKGRTYRPSRPDLSFWQSLAERARFYLWIIRDRLQGRR